MRESARARVTSAGHIAEKRDGWRFVPELSRFFIIIIRMFAGGLSASPHGTNCSSDRAT